MTENDKIRLKNLFKDKLSSIALDEDKYPNVYAVYREFQDYYGENNTDLQIGRDYLERLWNSMTTKTVSGILFSEVPEQFKKFIDDVHNLDWVMSSPIGTMEEKKLFINSIDVVVPTISPFLQFDILVKFSNITISNENDKSTLIEEIFAKTIIRHDGTLTSSNSLKWLRTKYSSEHWKAQYSHSHLPSRVLNSSRPVFKNPCLGNGPINTTMHTLHNESDLMIWRMYCHELDLAIRTESLEGGPYYRMENISTPNRREWALTQEKLAMYKQFSPSGTSAEQRNKLKSKRILSIVLNSGKLQLQYKDGSFRVVTPLIEYCKLLTDAYVQSQLELDVSQQTILDNLRTCNFNMKGDIVYRSSGESGGEEWFKWEGRKVFTFKGEDVKVQVVSIGNLSEFCYRLLDYPDIVYLNTLLTTIINIIYGRQEKFARTKIGAPSKAKGATCKERYAI